MRLRTVELTGVRRKIRVGLCYVLTILTAIGAAGYVLPAHRLPGDDAFHPNIVDGGALPLVWLAVVGMMAPVFARRRFGAGMIAAALGAIASIFTLVKVAAHEPPPVRYGYGQSILEFAVVALFAVSALLFVVEPVVYLLERRRLLLAARPAPLPVAKLRR